MFSSLALDYLSKYSSNYFRGDYDLVVDGIHENMLQLHYHDPVMQKTVCSCSQTF